MPPPTVVNGEALCVSVVRQAVRVRPLSVRLLTLISRDAISPYWLGGWMSTKLDTHIHQNDTALFIL